MAKTGYLPADSMAGTFDLLRANDLIFNYVGPNWLEGKTPPSFDILAWNNDSTRMPAKMHAFYLRHFYLENELARGELELLGEHLLAEVGHERHVHRGRRERPHRAVAHVVHVDRPARRRRHVHPLQRPGTSPASSTRPGKKAKHWIGTVGGESAPDADTWLQRASEVAGSWWEPWRDWIGERGGGMRTPPPTGSDAHPPLGDAPGSYVLGTA